nr:hypothetical protein [Tanacetum cinerariifolium]
RTCGTSSNQFLFSSPSLALMPSIRMLDGCKSLFDVQWVLDGCKSLDDVQWVLDRCSMVGSFDLSVVVSDLIAFATTNLGLECMLQNPSWNSLIMYSAWRGPTHCNHGLRNDLRYRTPFIKEYCMDFILTVRAFIVSTGSVPSVRYLSSGVIQEYPCYSTTAKISLSSVDFFSTSTKTCLVR